MTCNTYREPYPTFHAKYSTLVFGASLITRISSAFIPSSRCRNSSWLSCCWKPLNRGALKNNRPGVRMTLCLYLPKKKNLFTVCPMKYAVLLCFVSFCWYYSYWGIHVIYLPIFFKIISLALGKSYDCPSASEATLKEMGRISQCLTTTKYNKAQKLYIIQ